MIHATEAGKASRKAFNDSAARIAQENAEFKAENAETVNALVVLTMRLIEKEIDAATLRGKTDIIFVVSHQDRDRESRLNRLLLFACQEAFCRMMSYGYTAIERPDSGFLFNAQFSWHLHS